MVAPCGYGVDESTSTDGTEEVLIYGVEVFEGSVVNLLDIGFWEFAAKR